MKIQHITFAFYKGKGNFLDKLIRVFTLSKYSHVEIVIDDLWYASSPRDKGVRVKKIVPKEGHWDYINIPVSQETKEHIENFLKSQVGKGYDYFGILFGIILPLKSDLPDKWFCSELAVYVIKKFNVPIKYKMLFKEPPCTYTPGKLYRLLKGPIPIQRG